MREFGITYAKGFTRGLRRFPNPLFGEEALTECYNLAPTEQGLIAHIALTDVGITTPAVEYIRIRDQSGDIWYWCAGRALESLTQGSVFNFTLEGFDVIDVTPATVPYWLQVDAIDNPVTQMYIYPSDTTGDPIVHTSPPAIGTGYDIGAGLSLRSLSGWKHTLSATSAGDLFWSQLGV